MPEEFFGKVAQNFPRNQVKTTQKAEITVEDSGIASTEVENLAPVHQFLTETGDQIIQISENLLVVNQLQPYRHFKEWRELFFCALDIYEGLVSPRRVDRIGFRYINRFEIPAPEKAMSMDNYFNIFPTIPQPLGKTHGPFWIQFQVPQNNGKHTLFVTFGSEDTAQKSEGVLTFILDIYDSAQLDIELSMAELSVEIESAHNNLVRAFESSITDMLRELLGVKE